MIQYLKHMKLGSKDSIKGGGATSLFYQSIHEVTMISTLAFKSGRSGQTGRTNELQVKIFDSIAQEKAAEIISSER
jgi:hypothetical protein